MPGGTLGVAKGEVYIYHRIVDHDVSLLSLLFMIDCKAADFDATFKGSEDACCSAAYTQPIFRQHTLSPCFVSFVRSAAAL